MKLTRNDNDAGLSLACASRSRQDLDASTGQKPISPSRCTELGFSTKLAGARLINISFLLVEFDGRMGSNFGEMVDLGKNLRWRLLAVQ